MESRIRALLEPIIAEHDVVVLAVQVASLQRSSKVRVVLDASKGVPADVLEAVSRGLALQLDVDDPFAGRYTLEVSSPGLDWPLTTEDDFARHADEWLKAIDVHGVAVEGYNQGLEHGLVRLRLATGEIWQAPLQDLTKVVRSVNWKDASKKNKASAPNVRKGRKK